MATDQTMLAGEIAYQLTKRLVIDISTARAAVDAALASKPPAECAHEYHYFGDQQTRRRCVWCSELEPEPVAPPAREGWKEAAIAWTVCASIHEQWAKGKDALYKTRHADFERHANEARSKAISATPPAQAMQDKKGGV